jgi:DNA-binding beta-propeller fold protein YncE
MRFSMRNGLQFCLIASVVLAVAAAPASAHLAFVAKWGTAGTANGQFKNPQDVATDGAGHVYVVDRSNARVQKFDSNGSFLGKWGSGGTAPGHLFEPFGLGVGGGVVYVADSGNNRIDMFDTGGSFLGSFGSAGAGPGQFSFPTDVAVDRAGNVFVSDTNNFRVQRFTASGQFVGEWGGFGVEHGQFMGPWGLATDAAGHLYVADRGLSRVEQFSPSGSYLASFGGPDTLQTSFGVAVDGVGDVFVADTLVSQVQQYHSDGAFAGIGATAGTGNGELQAPFGMEFDSGTGNLYVADTGNNRIQRFSADLPPRLEVPEDVVIDATSPAGTQVNYTVAVSDDFDPNPSVECSPPSASTFPIGVTEVTCTARDDVDNVTVKSFTVTVRGAADQLHDLVADVLGYGLSSRGTEQSLIGKLEGALADLARGNDAAACGDLGAFVNHVAAQGGKKLSSGQAADLTAAALQIRAVLAC